LDKEDGLGETLCDHLALTLSRGEDPLRGLERGVELVQQLELRRADLARVDRAGAAFDPA
jgi:hypothetical protein